MTETPQAPDSSPTPSVLGWRQVAMSAKMLAKQASFMAHRFGDIRLACHDGAASRRCSALVLRFEQIAARVRQWPTRETPALDADRRWTVNELTMRGDDLRRLAKSAGLEWIVN